MVCLSCTRPLLEKKMKREFDNLSSYLPEWSASMLDRVFLLLEAQETKVKNAPESAVVSLIAQCIAFFFQAAPRGDAIRAKAEVGQHCFVLVVVVEGRWWWFQ